MRKKKTKTIPARMPKGMYSELDDALKIRMSNNLITRKDAKITEALRLAQRQPEWKSIIQKLKFQPRKEDLL